MPSAFDDMKILELSMGITGPYVSMLLGDLGAEVIKVEAPQGDPYRGTPGFVVWNRGKRSLKLDFKAPEARTIIHDLIKKSDILIIDFNAPQTQDLNLDYDSILQQNPRLILCSISPWGETGPLAGKPGSGRLVASYSGYIATQAGFTSDPVYVVMPYVEYKTGLHGACGLTAALLFREHTGRGQKLELSLLCDGGIYGIWGESLTMAIVELTTPFGHAPIYRIYQTKDGWVQIAAGNPAFCGKLFIAMGRELLVSDPRFVDLPWGVINPEDRRALEEIIGEWVRQYTNDEILDLLEQNDVPCGPVRTVEEFASHPQVRHSNMVIEIDDPNVGKVKQMGVLVSMSATPGEIKRPCPLLGQHSQEVLSELGYSEDQIRELNTRNII